MGCGVLYLYCFRPDIERDGYFPLLGYTLDQSDCHLICLDALIDDLLDRVGYSMQVGVLRLLKGENLVVNISGYIEDV